MNKYELGIKIDQIKKLAAKKEYTEAAAIAKDINWTKIKDWQALATAINVQEAVGTMKKQETWQFLLITETLAEESWFISLLNSLLKLEILIMLTSFMKNTANLHSMM